MELKANEFPLIVSGEQKTNKFKKNIITVLFFFSFYLKNIHGDKRTVLYLHTTVHVDFKDKNMGGNEVILI